MGHGLPTALRGIVKQDGTTSRPQETVQEHKKPTSKNVCRKAIKNVQRHATDHSACTKIFPQNRQRFTASKSSSTTQLFCACSGNQFAVSGSDDLQDSGRIAFLSQPTHLRIIPVDRINEVIEHRPEVADEGVQVNQVQYLAENQTE